MMKNERRTLKLTSPFDKFVSKAAQGDLDAMRTMVRKGFDVNSIDATGESVLAGVMYRYSQDLECSGTDSVAYRFDVIKQLLLWGADPNGHACQTAGPLVFAAMRMDYEMIELLLDAGADVNAIRILRGVPESVYDSAEFEYRYAVWPEWMEEADNRYRGDENEWLSGLDQAARRWDRTRPWHLRLLRTRGALSHREMF